MGRMSGHGLNGRSAAERLRTELARELHDRVAQTLTAMLVEMENFKAVQFGRQGVLREIANYQDSTREVLGNIRALLFELRDEHEIGHDFVPWLRERLARFEARSGIASSLWVSRGWPPSLASQAASQLRRIIDEALQNVRLHSGARTVRVRLDGGPEQVLTVTVKDDGQRVDEVEPGLGMLGMRERVLLLGGELRVLQAVPHGTLLQATFPKEKIT